MLVKVIVLMFQLVLCYGEEDNVRKLYISPVGPVRLNGQNLEVEVRTDEKFLEYSTVDQLTLEFDDEAVNINPETIGSTAVFVNKYTDLDKGGWINATLTTPIALNVSTNLVVVQDSPMEIVGEKHKETDLTCLNPSEQNSYLRFKWIVDNVEKGSTLSVKADEKAALVNYTCVIATADAVKHYGSIMDAYNEGSAISVRRNLSVLNDHMNCNKEGVCNITACLDGMPKLNMTFTDMDGNVLKHGFPNMSILTNKSDSVQLVVYSGTTELFRKNITEESHESNEINGSSDLPAGLIVLIVICVVMVPAVIVLVLVICFVKKRGYWPSVCSNGSRNKSSSNGHLGGEEMQNLANESKNTEEGF